MKARILAAGRRPSEWTRWTGNWLTDLEFHILDTAHFALEEEGPFIAQRMLAFLDKTQR